jgi:PmbA protein
MIKEHFSIQNDEISIDVQDSKIHSVKNKNITRKSVRIFDQNKKILALSAGVGNIDDNELENRANELINLNIPYNYELEKDTQGTFNKEKCSIKDYAELETMVNKILDDLKDISKDYVLSGKSNLNRYSITLKNSDNLDLKCKRDSVNIGFSMKLKGSGNILDAFTNISGFDITDEKYANFLKDTDFIAKACQSEIIPLENKEYKVLFQEDMILQKFYSDISGTEYEEGTSLLAGKKNQIIFNENIIIKECYDDEANSIFIPFDHEGIVRTDYLTIVENGLLKTILYDKKKAAKYETISTGNGFRAYNSHPNIGCRGLIFDNVKMTANELIADEFVIIPFINSGGDFLPNGNFTFPTMLAFVFKNGKFIGKAPQISITGNYLDCFNKNFISLAKNDILKEMMNQTLILSNAMVNVN